MGVCNCFMFCCTLFCVRSGVVVVLEGRRGLIALLGLSSWCLVVVGRLFLAVPQGCLRFVIVVFTDHTRLLFWIDGVHIWHNGCARCRDDTENFQYWSQM